MIAFSAGPFLSYASMRSRYICTSARQVSVRAFRAAWMSAMVASSVRKSWKAPASIGAARKSPRARMRGAAISRSGVCLMPVLPSQRRGDRALSLAQVRDDPLPWRGVVAVTNLSLYRGAPRRRRGAPNVGGYGGPSRGPPCRWFDRLGAGVLSERHRGDDERAEAPVMGALPLEGMRVLELGHIVAGPSAGLLLADLGADVVKVERPGEGDQTRGMPAGNAANFHFLNRNKRSITIDLKGSVEGRELFLRLVKTSDVVIDNFAYGAVEALGLGYDVLARANPGLIYLALKGFLPGPYEARPFLDELAQMSAGLAFMTGPRGQPMRAGASIVDVGAAAYGVIAVLAALQQRAHTGRGQQITSGLFETTVFWVAQWLAQHAATGEPSAPMPEIRQGTRMGWGVYQLFTASDGEQIFIGITSNGHWERFCKEFALSDLLGDERLADNARRVAARDWLPDRIQQEMARHTGAELSERLERAKVPFAPLRRPDQLVDDPHLNASGQFVATPLPGRGPAKLPKLPVRSSAFEMELRRPAPRLGEHTREVLQELGISKDEIDALASRRVIG